MRFNDLAKSILVPAVLAIGTTLPASDKEEQYVIKNKTDHHIVVICGDWIDSPIILHKGNKETKFKSKKFHIMHVMYLDKEGMVVVKDYLAQNVPGFRRGERFAFDQGGTYEITTDGLSRVS